MIKTISLFVCLMLTLSCQAEQTWYFIRHFEKQQGADPHLSDLGQQRSQALVAALDGKTLSKIYSTQYNRTLESVAPLADKRGLEVTYYDPAKLENFAKQIKNENNIIIVGHSNTTPRLIRLLGGEIADLTETDFGQLFTLTKQHQQAKLSIQNLGVKLAVD